MKTCLQRWLTKNFFSFTKKLRIKAPELPITELERVSSHLNAVPKEQDCALSMWKKLHEVVQFN